MIQTAIGAPPRPALPARIPGLLAEARATAEIMAKAEEAEKAKQAQQRVQAQRRRRGKGRGVASQKRKAEEVDAPEGV